jgi:hypothetical protein
MGINVRDRTAVPAFKPVSRLLVAIEPFGLAA